MTLILILMIFWRPLMNTQKSLMYIHVLLFYNICLLTCFHIKICVCSTSTNILFAFLRNVNHCGSSFELTLPLVKYKPLYSWKTDQPLSQDLHVHNQEFFRAGEVSENKGTSINIFNLQHTKERLHREKFGYFFPKYA